MLSLFAVVMTATAVAAGPEVVPLWAEGAPVTPITGSPIEPFLERYDLPAGDGPFPTIIVCPGGGYRNLALDHEGVQIATWLTEHGIAAFVLHYRHAPEYRHPAPLTDAQRAIRLVRTNAAQWDVDPQRIGILGFSAGGHLTATAGTLFDAGDPNAKDPVDRASCRPDFFVLCYPVITLEGPYTHTGSRDNLLGENPDPALLERMSPEKQVTAETPPAFLFHTSEDTGVPPENSVIFYEALHAKGVPSEMHIFEKGPHGVGLAQKDPALSQWPELLFRWLQGRGIVK